MTTAAVAALLGLGTGIGLLLIWNGSRASPYRAPGSWRTGIPVLDQRTLLRLAAAAAVGVLTVAVTGWLVGALLAALAVWSLPRMLGRNRDHELRVARIEAIAAWTEMLRDTLAAAAGIEQAPHRRGHRQCPTPDRHHRRGPIGRAALAMNVHSTPRHSHAHGNPRATPVAVRALRGTVALAALVVLLGGVPWALARYIGWPLPDHLPTWAEIQGTLTTPLNTSLLLSILAVLCWLAWAVFLVDVIRAIPAAVRAAFQGVPQPAVVVRSGPVHAFAATLVTAVVVALLAYRPPLDSPTATAVPVTAPSVDDQVRLAAAATASPERSAQQVVVREPRDGVYDCLWRIADRKLGDGARWPEIYRLNQGRPQADGRSLTDPNLIYPGWILVLPDTTPPAPTEPPEDDRPPVPETHTTPTPPTPTSSLSQPTVLPSALTPAPSATTPADPDPTEATRPAITPPSTPTSADQPRPPGIDLGPGAFVGLGLAAAVGAALLVAHRRHRRWYQPGSGFRADLPVAPVVRTLRVARRSYLESTRHSLDKPDPVPDGEMGTASVAGRPLSSPDRSAPAAGGGTRAGLTVGVQDDKQVVLDLARHRGLGLVGPGAAGVARGLLLGLLTADETSTTQVLIPHDDAGDLIDLRGRQGRWPAKLRVVTSLDAALDEVEGEISRRAHLAPGDTSVDPAPHLLVLVATPGPDTIRRLQAVLENGSTVGVAGVLLGQWRSGATVQVREDGAVRATNPGPAQQLRGARLFTLPALQAAELLTLLRDTEAAASQPSSTSDPAAVTDPTEASPRASPSAARSPTRSAEASTWDDPAHNRSAVALSWSILGPPRLTWHPHDIAQDLTTALTPRQRELLVYIALHPDGVSRDTLAEALWPERPADRPSNALHTTLSRLRRTLHTVTSDENLAGLVTVRGDRYQLTPELIEVDYWHFTGAVHRSRVAAADADRVAADQQILAVYHGELAAGLVADWVDVPREAARRDAIDAAARLARALVDTDLQRALHLLERACGFDPYNELIYRDIMRLQARLSRPDAISRTLSLLTSRLAELDEHPDPATVALAHDLQHDGPEPDQDEAQSSRTSSPR